MADENYSFTQARARLEDIVTQVRKKDVSLEQSLDLLEEGVRLANSCTELIDHTEWQSVVAESETPVAASPDAVPATPDSSLAETVDVDASESVDAVSPVIDDADDASEFLEADDAWTDGSPEQEPAAPE